VRPIRCLYAPVAVLAVALAISACGDDEEGGEGQGGKPKAVTFTLSGSGKNLKMSGPKTVPGGVVRIEFRNNAKGEHGAQLGYVDEGHTAQEGLKAGVAWGEENEALPDWLHLQGGIGNIEGGQSDSVTQELPGGEYFVTDIESGAVAYFRVSGDEGGEEPSAPATVEASEYKFEASGLRSGKNQVLFDNAGQQPHVLVGLRMKPGKTIEEVRRFFRTEKGEPPIVEEGSFDTAIVDGGVKQTIAVDAQQGKYALLCFIPDRQGGPPHTVKGMVSEATVN
jgi:hypothetical protein